ncbi:2-polyprenyl-6-methoxyphenol hydroxylase-like FAD-dependent oxidoreductase [Geothermobacter ehrlichii]|uniref:2-polyprenyl-6-methoxyphenol hydroxylase-like FAD-dependent oxidoreductase n=1 Tax=Geothermobacter ehrlichii TaxID=213224 RepID=A0A5D3WL35_9BACT|nr:NAD(P)/FAD-dependent oxidoreductase [Geothermobacter ehrlichii]TYO99098.1 2-polyprenyl-6-methoxyphenol hydroxylase-like FAD-dependent oxidoreductase [Geothermobacter ehrlichii]
MATQAWDVLIVGAGPVGLLLGNLLGQTRKRVLLIDRHPGPPTASMAIGITPPSLAILRTLDLDRRFCASGVRVEHAVVHGHRRRLGELSFAGLDSPWPFILSQPQATTVRLLEENLTRFPNVELRRELHLERLEQQPGQVEVELRTASGHPLGESCRFLAGCSGAEGSVRRQCRLADQPHSYPQSFLMADFADSGELGGSAHLWFTADGSVESFPLPQQRRRWIIQTPQLCRDVDPGYLPEIVARRTGCRLRSPPLFQSAFGVRRLLARSYVRGRVVLAGDAAHLMSPVGGQGMNTGFADAAWLAQALDGMLTGSGSPALLEEYSTARREAARVAIGRAGRGMWLGTRRGRLHCLWREPLLKLLLSPAIRHHLPPYFAMLTIPNNPPQACPALGQRSGTCSS